MIKFINRKYILGIVLIMVCLCTFVVFCKYDGVKNLIFVCKIRVLDYKFMQHSEKRARIDEQWFLREQLLSRGFLEKIEYKAIGVSPHTEEYDNLVKELTEFSKSGCRASSLEFNVLYSDESKAGTVLVTVLDRPYRIPEWKRKLEAKQGL